MSEEKGVTYRTAETILDRILLDNGIKFNEEDSLVIDSLQLVILLLSIEEKLKVKISEELAIKIPKMTKSDILHTLIKLTERGWF